MTITLKPGDERYEDEHDDVDDDDFSNVSPCVITVFCFQ